MSDPESAGPRLADAIRDQWRPFVVYWNNIPSPYMVECFNALAGRDAFEFEVWFNDRIQSDRSWAVDEALWRWCACCAGRPAAVCWVPRQPCRSWMVSATGAFRLSPDAI